MGHISETFFLFKKRSFSEVVLLGDMITLNSYNLLESSIRLDLQYLQIFPIYSHAVLSGRLLIK